LHRTLCIVSALAALATTMIAFEAKAFSIMPIPNQDAKYHTRRGRMRPGLSPGSLRWLSPQHWLSSGRLRRRLSRRGILRRGIPARGVSGRSVSGRSVPGRSVPGRHSSRRGLPPRSCIPPLNAASVLALRSMMRRIRVLEQANRGRRRARAFAHCAYNAAPIRGRAVLRT
jgi:hypothetical protein